MVSLQAETGDPLLRPTCPHCRYNLEGLPDGPCPECGEPFTLEVLLNPPPKPSILADGRIYCVFVAVITFLALVPTTVPLMGFGGVVAVQMLCSLLMPARWRGRAPLRSIGSAVATVGAGAGFIVLGLGLDLLIVGVGGLVEPYHWTRFESPFAPRRAPLAERIVTRDQCLIAAGRLLPVGFLIIVLTRRSIGESVRVLLTRQITQTRTSETVRPTGRTGAEL